METVRIFDARETQADPNRLDSELDAISHAIDGGLSLYLVDRGELYGILFGTPWSIAEAMSYLTTAGVAPHNYGLAAGSAIAFIEADGPALRELLPEGDDLFESFTDRGGR